ncbi:MAG: isoprenylcysteine carboxylmethyltransferase family protein [Bacteroidetes bacterium]|nr:isoprenylcysteine carboxylmethyltransferase family protein [Bacteroidota bacterium]
MHSEKEHTKEGIISHLASYPPLIYLGALVLGLIIDFIIPLRIMPQAFFLPLGIVLFFLSPLLIFWAQYSSYFFSKEKENKERSEIKAKHFRRGPYCFSRHPSYLGVAFLVFGFGFLLNSIFIVGLAAISFLVVYFVFVKREERILAKKYGEEYLEYKNSVRCWF